MNYKEYERMVDKKTDSAIESVRMLKKWFLVAFYLRKFTDREINTICENLPDGEDLLKLFWEKRRNKGDFFNKLLDLALKGKVKPKQKTPVSYPIIKFMQKKLVGK